MSVALTEMHQAALFDIQEKIAETHELLKREEEFSRRHQELMEARHENAVRIGQNLNYFKDKLPHGKFIPFVQTEYGMSRTLAWNYMNLAEQNTNVQRVEHFPLRTEFELASPSTPAVIVQMVETKQIAPTVAAIREAKREVLADSFPPTATVEHPILNTLTSKSNEWYTPWEYLDAARRLMGGIDLDPASNPFANETVMATTYYDIDTNGLDKPWHGRVWLNPPYGRSDSGSNQEIWTRRLIEQYNAGITKEAVLLVNASVDTKWFQHLFDHLEREPHFPPVCIPTGRINFHSPDSTASGPTHGSALVYFGPNIKDFYVIFSQFGIIFERMTYRW